MYIVHINHQNWVMVVHCTTIIQPDGSFFFISDQYFKHFDLLSFIITSTFKISLVYHVWSEMLIDFMFMFIYSVKKRHIPLDTITPRTDRIPSLTLGFSYLSFPAQPFKLFHLPFCWSPLKKTRSVMNMWQDTKLMIIDQLTARGDWEIWGHQFS